MAGKTVIEHPVAVAFAASMSQASVRKYLLALKVLAVNGCLRAPLAEKVEGQENLFAIRIVTDGNERFFYCHDAGTSVYVLSGYQKRTRRIPLRELNRALRIRNEILGGGHD